MPARPGGFAWRLARSPVDLVTRLGMARSNAYYAAGCPLELCDHAAARDLWQVIYRDAAAAAAGGGNPKSEIRDPKAVSEGRFYGHEH